MGAEDIRSLLRASGSMHKVIIERHLEEMSDNHFLRCGVEIYYKDSEGTIREIFNIDELHEKSLSIDEVINSDGVVRFQKKDGKIVFLTRAPEKNQVRVWVPLEEEDIGAVRNTLVFYDGFENIPFEELATIPIQIGGDGARQLHKKAVYFELDLRGARIREKFPEVDSRVAEFASKDYGQVMTQEKLGL